MDDGTAFNLIGKTASLLIDGRRVDGVMVTGNQVGTSGSFIELSLPTPVGAPSKHIRVRMDKVELAP